MEGNGYFDHNATTPLSPAAREAWLSASAVHWHNPSSLYREAGGANRRLEEEREKIAASMGCEAGRIVFTSGATESAVRALDDEATQAEILKSAHQLTVELEVIKKQLIRLQNRDDSTEL